MICFGCEQSREESDFYPAHSKRTRALCKDCARAKRRVYYAQNQRAVSAKTVALRRERELGITQDEYDSLLKAQGGVCAACGNPENQVRRRGVIALAVDHCHKTGRLRGLLCSKCNRALGLLADDASRIGNLQKYIENH